MVTKYSLQTTPQAALTPGAVRDGRTAFDGMAVQGQQWSGTGSLGSNIVTVCSALGEVCSTDMFEVSYLWVW